MDGYKDGKGTKEAQIQVKKGSRKQSWVYDRVFD
jgi:hypothetical protein